MVEEINKYTTVTNVIEIEFPSILLGKELVTLDLSKKVDHTTYKKCFIQEHLVHNLVFDTFSEELCLAELWIIKNNPKYDYLYKETKLTL